MLKSHLRWSLPNTGGLGLALLITGTTTMNAKRVSKPKRVAIYLRVSTTGQTTQNQRRELVAAAERHGWEIVSTFEDAGYSGAKGRTERPGLDALMKGVARKEFEMVAAWSVDRLGRSLTDLLDLLKELHAKDVDLYLHQQGLDTSTPAGRAMFQMLGVFAEFERSMIRERVKAGMAPLQTTPTVSHRCASSVSMRCIFPLSGTGVCESDVKPSSGHFLLW